MKVVLELYFLKYFFIRLIINAMAISTHCNWISNIGRKLFRNNYHIQNSNITIINKNIIFSIICNRNSKSTDHKIKP